MFVAIFSVCFRAQRSTHKPIRTGMLCFGQSGDKPKESRDSTYNLDQRRNFSKEKPVVM